MKLQITTSILIFFLAGCGADSKDSEIDKEQDNQDLPQNSGQLLDLTSKNMRNEVAYIPPQCYTDTIDSQDQVYNPCYSCHIPSSEPNYINDGDLQLAYIFPEYAQKNHWENLFKDRTQTVAAIADEEIINYVRRDNYKNERGEIILANVLANVPSGWDFNKDGVWSGYTPDSYFNFDGEGFDRNPDGEITGWRAFAYTPFLGTFWPTNGSTDDVLIRLSDVFRYDENGEQDLTVYKLNLAIVESLIKRKNIMIDSVDERKYGVDLDKNGRLATAEKITYDWAPLEGRSMSFVGQARLEQEAGKVHLAAGLFPEGTEFLHSVRYIDIKDDGGIAIAPRMKELRYAKKIGWQTYAELEAAAMAEIKEKSDFPDRLKEYIGDVEKGISNNQGWVYQGFIEDANGELRPQTFEETVFCMGCHGTIGATTDGVFAFPRKLNGSAFQQGWYHWAQKDLKGLTDPIRSDGKAEYAWYLEQNGAGDEFRSNEEVINKFFTQDGKLLPDAIARLANDITYLINPSTARALLLNKAYKTIVEEQSFVAGRDATITPMQNIHKKRVREDQPTGIETIITGP